MMDYKHNFVDVWYGDILLATAEQRHYWSFLSTAEKTKSARFKRTDLQKKYIATRAILRKVLSGYLSVQPQQLLIKIAAYGKPFISNPINSESNLYFNLSHQGNKLVIVVSNINEVGIDIEQCRPRKNMTGLVAKYFVSQEAQFWFATPKTQQTNMLYRFWVRKEAFVKAVGRGLALGLKQCIINPHQQSCFLKLPAHYGATSDWKILDIKLNIPNAHYVCAVVLKTSADFALTQMALKQIWLI